MAKVPVQLASSPTQISQIKAIDLKEKFVLADERNGNFQLQPAVPYKIVHALSGRVRFRIPKLLHDKEYARRLELLLDANSQVMSFRINRAAACSDARTSDLSNSNSQ